ncbi:pilin [Patescibacteria group bacterium]|nr:pilin [Patescibacteria group bacterium]
MSKTKISLIIMFVAMFGVLMSGSFVYAQISANTEGPNIGLEYGQYTGLGSQDIRFTVAMIIRAVLGALGTVALAIIVYAGFKWMTAGGNDENVASAKKILTAAIIGLVIIFSAYAITRFVTTELYKATKNVDYDIEQLTD